MPPRLVIGDANGAVQVWEAGAQRTIGRHEGAVNDLAIVGDAIVSTGNDKVLHVWPLGARAPSQLALEAVSGDLAISPDGTRIALAGRDGRVRIVVANHVVTTLQLPGTAGEVVEVAWSPDSERIAAGVLDGRVVEWDVATGSARELSRHQPGLVRVAFARGGELVGSGRDGVARLWSAEHASGARIVRQSTVLQLAASRDGTVALADQHGEIAILDGDVRTIHRGDPASALLISPRGDRVWAATWDGRVRRWDGDRVSLLDAGAGMTWALAARGGQFAAAGDAGLRAWDGDGAAQLLVGHTGTVRSVALLPDGRVLSGGSDRTLRLWAPPKSSEPQSTEPPGHRILASESGEVYLVAVSEDGAYAASVTTDSLRLWRTTDWSSHQFSFGSRIRAIAFSPDGSQLAATTAGAVIALVNVTLGSSRNLAGPESGSNRLAFSPDSRHFATSGGDGLVRVWSVASSIDRVAHRFDAESYDVAWTGPTTIVASSADKSVWSGSGVGPFVSADRASIRALLATTTAEIDPAGVATTTGR